MDKLKHSGDSANIAFYRERQQVGYIWVEVLRHGFTRRNGEIKVTPPEFRFTINRFGEGEIGRFSYKPRKKVAAGRLSEEVVTRKVRDWLNKP